MLQRDIDIYLSLLPSLILVLLACGQSRDISIFDPKSKIYIPAITTLEKNGKTATAYSEQGILLWTKNFSAWVEHTDISDIDRDGVTDAIIGLTGNSETPGFEEAGYIYAINTSAEKILEISPPPFNIYQPWRSIYEISGLMVDDIFGTGDGHIIATWKDPTFFASIISILNFEGDSLGYYWHPGIIDRPKVVDLNRDGQKEFLVTGVNNDIQSVTGFPDTIFNEYGNYGFACLLEVNSINGQAPPYFGVDVNPKSGIWYLIFPQFDAPSPISINTQVKELFLGGLLEVVIELELQVGNVTWIIDPNAEVKRKEGEGGSKTLVKVINIKEVSILTSDTTGYHWKELGIFNIN